MAQSKTNNIVLQAKNISKTFGGIKALDSVNLEIYRGQVNAIVGENGAGKSTLMKVLTGIYQEYDGQIMHCNNTPGIEPDSIFECGGERLSGQGIYQSIRLD
jgi:ABC-type sugar transport system ATPase subunit